MGLRRRANLGLTGGAWPGQAAITRSGPLRPPPPPWGQDQRPPEQVPPGVSNPVWTHASDPAPSTSPEPAAPTDESTREASEWDPVVAVDRPSRWVRARRVAVLGALGAVIAVGAVDIARTAAGLVASPAPAPAPAVTDQQLAGFATAAAVDYLSWDAAAPAQRQAALARYAAPGALVDGWDGKGRLWADAPSVLDVRRDGDRAVATVRVRVIPAAAPPAAPGQPDARGDAGALAAAAPGPATTGTGSARWVTLALPIASDGGRPVITARPALVGSAPEAVPDRLLTASSTGDAALARATQPAVTRLLNSYASGDLTYARASGTQFAGLDGAARLAEVQRWQVAEPSRSGTEEPLRHGRAEVTWQLTGGAGELTSDYSIDLSNQDGRWYLASVAPDTPAVIKENR